MTYNKNTWNPYNSSMTYDQNKTNGGVVDSAKLNNMETGISNAFDKTSDTIGGRNLLINTSISSTNRQTTMQGASSAISGVYSRTDSYEQLTASSDGELFYRFVGPDTNNLYNLTPGETYTLSGSASHTSGVLDFRAQYSTDRSSWNNLEFTTTNGNDLEIPVSDGSVLTPFSHTFTIPVGATGVYFSLENFGYTTGGLFRFKNMKLEKGSVATDWCPNPEDKVNVADMRKPASDVAGIEEVNAKQDKIGYTPADDSKVVHNYDTVNTQNYVLNSSDSENVQGDITNSNAWKTIYFLNHNLPAGTYFYSFDIAVSNYNQGAFQVQFNADNSSGPGGIWDSLTGVIPIPQTGGHYQGYITTSGIALANKGLNLQIISSSSNISIFNLIINSSSVPVSWLPSVDDYKNSLAKVAHLSGANNFNTIPTVNNNPLLLASSLPSDLARLSHDANFTAKLQQNGQDVALVNNTIYRNPNTGSISTANTFTQPQTFSIAPTIKDASKDKGDNQAATMADLKSVENSAWHQLTLPDNTYLKNISLLYKADIANNELYIQARGELIAKSTAMPLVADCQLIDLSSIVDTLGDSSYNSGRVIGADGGPIATCAENGETYTQSYLSTYISNKHISVNGTNFSSNDNVFFNFIDSEKILLADDSSDGPYMTINVTKFADGII